MADSKYAAGDESVTMEGRFVEHYFKALDNLQACWNNDSGFNKERFNQQLLYLVRLVPDKTRQLEILKMWGESSAATKLIVHLSDAERQYFAGMEVVTELVMFICDAFELINTDITGPGTSKQYRDAAIQVQDMKFDADIASEIT